MSTDDTRSTVGSLLGGIGVFVLLLVSGCAGDGAERAIPVGEESDEPHTAENAGDVQGPVEAGPSEDVSGVPEELSEVRVERARIEPSSCRLSTDVVLAEMSEVPAIAGPSIAVGPAGRARVTWARYGDGWLHTATPESGEWSVRRRLRGELSTGGVHGVATATNGSRTAALVQHAGGTSTVDLYVTGDDGWRRVEQFENDAGLWDTRPSSIRVDANGTIHALVGESAGRYRFALNYVYGEPGDLTSRKLLESDGRISTLDMTRGPDGSVDIFYARPPGRHVSRAFHLLDGPSASARTFERLSARKGVGHVRDYATDGAGHSYVLTGVEGGLAVLRGRANDAWQAMEIVRTTDASWRRKCKGNGWERGAADKLDGRTCQVDHAYTPWRETALLSYGGEVWVAKMRHRIRGRATWRCKTEAERRACEPYCRLEPDLERSSTLMFGRVGADGVNFQSTDIDVPPGAFRNLRIGPKGDLHLAYAADIGDAAGERRRRIRYRRIRCSEGGGS